MNKKEMVLKMQMAQNSWENHIAKTYEVKSEKWLEVKNVHAP